MMDSKYIILLSLIYSVHFISLTHSQTEPKYVRARKGVAANVAASASSKTQPVPISSQMTTSSRASTFSYDEPLFTISDSNLWNGLFTAEEKLVAQLLNRGSLTVRPNGYMNQSTNPVHVNITYNVVQILGFSQSEETLSISGWFTLISYRNLPGFYTVDAQLDRRTIHLLVLTHIISFFFAFLANLAC
ncbi:hypothetical protein MN116_001227 [Schistosoma mekongi]|uniref:Uncharacterized protein n=1 Tax=Schistosoma mekongi TaxID=38744 RepID=A0AAE2D9E2_SCHME|nr:hypothetical protein MN116_001227 [Schistosoma mekongi]